MTFRCGELNCLVSLQHREEIDDAAGDIIPTFVEFAQVWAAIRPQTGSEAVAEQALIAGRASRMTMRFRDDVTAKDRIVHEGTNYNVEAVLHRDFRRDELTLLVTDGLTEG